MNAHLWPTAVKQFTGRIFRTEIMEGFQVKIMPLKHIAGSKNYEDVLKDDRLNAQCFFDLMPEIVYTGRVGEYKLRCVFFVNLEALYPALSRTEATMQAQIDTEKVLSSYVFTLERFVLGVTAVKDYVFKDATISDMQPHFIYRVDLKILLTNC